MRLYLGLDPVEMPSQTTGRYAAKRVAEHIGLDPDEREWWLKLWPNGSTIDPEEVVAEHDGQAVVLLG